MVRGGRDWRGRYGNGLNQNMHFKILKQYNNFN